MSSDSPETVGQPASTRPDGVVSSGAETLVLNRLPLAILVFRDQQVLFANRALTDLLGYESVEGCAAPGLRRFFRARTRPMPAR